MTAKSSQESVIHVHESHDGDRNYVFHLSDNDIFVRTGRQLIEACQLNISIELWMKELDLMLVYIRDQCAKKSEHIRSCLCEPRRARLVLHFIPKSTGFDFDLAEWLTDLDRYLSRNFKNVGLVEAGQIPFTEMATFSPCT